MMTIYNYLRLGELLHTSGQPTASQLEVLGSQGIRTVINLALPTSDNAVATEAAILTGQGIRYFQIPVDWQRPLEEDFSLFTKLLPLVDHEPLLVHCALNMRVSAFCYLYRRVVLGCSHREAAGDLMRIWPPVDQWYLYMNNILEKAGLGPEDFT